MIRKNKLIYFWLVVMTILFIFAACSYSAHWERNSGLRGSADVCSGNTVICTVFVNNPTDVWDFSDSEDTERRGHIRTYLGIACDYLEHEASRYDQRLKFTWDFEAQPNLAFIYDTNLSYEAEGWDEALWRYLDENVDLNALSEQYHARNIIFLTCMNTDESCEAVTSTRSWYPDMPYPYEFISLYYIDSGVVNCPAVYAHEILHTFGAPDLYMEDEEYDIGDDFVSWVALNLPNDIMYHCSDAETGDYVYDRITNEISEVTAYYIGWLPESRIVKENGLAKSQY